MTVSDLYEVELSSADPAFEPKDLTRLFGLTATGVVAAIDASTVTVQLATILSDVRMRVIASDTRGFSYAEVVSFAPGIFRVDGELAAPPSQQSLSVGGITVHVRFGNGIETTITTDGAGKFQLSQIPGSMLSIYAVTESGGNTYNGWAHIAVDTNKQVLVRMLGLADIVYGVPPWELGLPDTVPQLLPTQGQNRVPGVATGAKRSLVPPSAHAQVTVTAAGANAPISGSDTYEVAKGTKKVFLTYEVLTAAYPDLVLQQSRWSDTWQLSVLTSSGVQLFSTGRAVNSQRYSPPTWNSAGGTGKLQQGIDVSAFTANGNIALTVVGIATNIGDEQRPTTVTASLDTVGVFTINTITMDTVPDTRGQSDRYSIPPAGGQNHFQRHFDVEFSPGLFPDISLVNVELLDSTGAVLQTSSPPVQLVNDTTLRVEVTFSNTTSQVASTPPPTDQIRYRFTLFDTESFATEPRESAAFFALWRMPDGFARFSPASGADADRDLGLDDWAAQRTYTWLENNRALVTRINDISGEHARDLMHQTHFEGRDIDMFHVYTFPNGAASGGANYRRLKENVRAALMGDAPALAQVDAWAIATRDRFDSFIADNDVGRIYYARGSADPGQPTLAVGWAQALLENGSYTNPDNLVVNLGAGAWGNAGNRKMRFDADHNDHFHVRLRG